MFEVLKENGAALASLQGMIFIRSADKNVAQNSSGFYFEGARSGGHGCRDSS